MKKKTVRLNAINPCIADAHACEDSFKFYRGGYGDGKKSFETSHEDLIETSTVELLSGRFCAYCLSPSKSIQAGLRQSCRDYGRENYDVTGHTCVCQKAMNEIKLKEQMNVLVEEFSIKADTLIRESNCKIEVGRFNEIQATILLKKAKDKRFSASASDFKPPVVHNRKVSNPKSHIRSKSRDLFHDFDEELY